MAEDTKGARRALTREEAIVRVGRHRVEGVAYHVRQANGPDAEEYLTNLAQREERRKRYVSIMGVSMPTQESAEWVKAKRSEYGRVGHYVRELLLEQFNLAQLG